MAVDYWHRLIVTGHRETVDLFRQQLRRRTIRSGFPGEKLSHETIPFSFVRLYQLIPTAERIDPNGPFEPYDLSVWPIRPRLRGLGEVRYQLHTRDTELLPFVRILSKRFAKLTFCLVTFCLDDSDVVSYEICNGCVRKWILPQSRREVHWERARQEFGLTGESVYDDDVATKSAEEAMLDEAIEHWERPSREHRQSRSQVRNWSNRPVVREFFREMEIVLAKTNESYCESESIDASGGTRKLSRSNSSS